MSNRIKTSTLLRQARRAIATNTEQYICIALEICAYDIWKGVERQHEDVFKRTQRVVHSRMQMGRFEKWVDKHKDIAGYDYHDPYSKCETSLDWWLVWKGYVKADAMPTKQQMREYRLAWLDALINEFEAKGD